MPEADRMTVLYRACEKGG